MATESPPIEYPHVASSSSTTPTRASHPTAYTPSAYLNLNGFPDASHSQHVSPYQEFYDRPQESFDHSTPFASTRTDNEQTPIAPTETPIPASFLPSSGLIQPFPNAFISPPPGLDPSALPPPPMSAGSDYDWQYSPTEPITFQPLGFHPMPPHFAPNFQHEIAPVDFMPTRSPTSSLSSTSLVRSHSQSSVNRPSRPKHKLSHQDKRSICEMAKKDTSLRQEDIAQMFGVDRSTISKILRDEKRWGPEETLVTHIPRAPKASGGRYPAIEAMVNQWYDEQLSMGSEPRDKDAQAKAIAVSHKLGFPHGRFKASVKWLSQLKERRLAERKPVSLSQLGPRVPFYFSPPETAPVPMSRGPSTATSSSDSSGYKANPDFNPQNLSRSEPDLTSGDTPSRQRMRSQSSPQVFDPSGNPIVQQPMTGPVRTRPMSMQLYRHNTIHNAKPASRRPPISRANSATNSLRRGGSIGASALGLTSLSLTPLSGNGDAVSPSMTASTSSGSHSRARSDVSLGPVASSIDSLTISPNTSESSEASGLPTLPNSAVSSTSLPPSAVMTPIRLHETQFYPQDFNPEMQHSEMPRYATYHGHVQYPEYQMQDFGPVPYPHEGWQEQQQYYQPRWAGA